MLLQSSLTALRASLEVRVTSEARLTVPCSLRLKCAGLIPLKGRTAELALLQHLQSIVPMHGLGPPAAGQVVVQMAGNRATGGGGAFVFGLRRADSSWSNSSLEATAGGVQPQPEHQSP